MKQKGNSEVSSSIALAITRWVPSLVCFLQLEPGLHHDSLLTIVFCNCSCSTGWARQVRGVYTLSLLWSLPFDLSPSEQLQGRYLTPGVLSPGKSFPPWFANVAAHGRDGDQRKDAWHSSSKNTKTHRCREFKVGVASCNIKATDLVNGSLLFDSVPSLLEIHQTDLRIIKITPFVPPKSTKV